MAATQAGCAAAIQRSSPSAASEAVAIPTGVQIFCLIATLAAGRITRSVPMLFAFGSLVIFVLGGLTGVMVAIVPFDFQAHDSFFVVGHFHYVLIGGALFPIFAGCYYFFPLINGKRLSDRLGRIGFWVAFIVAATLPSVRTSRTRFPAATRARAAL